MANEAFLKAQDPLYTGLKYFGHNSFRPGQESVINHVLTGHDALVIMPTGGGKSLCYQMPGSLRHGVAVIVSPLIALMNDQINALKNKNIPADAWHSDLSAKAVKKIEQNMLNKELKFLYLSPERFTHPHTLSLLQQVGISLVAIDEAHCVSMWGHDFRPSYMQMKVVIAKLREKANFPIMALTATADRTTQREIIEHLGLDQAKVFLGSFERKNISINMYQRPALKTFQQYIIKRLRALEGQAAIIYCQSRQATEDMAKFLSSKKIIARAYHAGLSKADRHETHHAFLDGECQVVCATIAFGMGIDHPHIRLVIHAQLPKSIEAYYQEIGRAGRDGMPAHAELFMGNKERAVHRFLIRKSHAQLSRKNIELFKLEAMECLANAPGCKMQLIRNYFGENADICGQCCVCLGRPQWHDHININQHVSEFIRLAHQQQRPKGMDWWVRELGLNKELLKACWPEEKSLSQKAFRQRARYFIHYLFLHHVVRWSKQGDGHTLLQLTSVALQIMQGNKSIVLPRHQFLLN
jgi:ATP-dependent DNA helicase RecQ